MIHPSKFSNWKWASNRTPLDVSFSNEPESIDTKENTDMIIIKFRVIEVAEMIEFGTNVVQLFDVDDVEVSFINRINVR